MSVGSKPTILTLKLIPHVMNLCRNDLAFQQSSHAPPYALKRPARNDLKVNFSLHKVQCWRIVQANQYHEFMKTTVKTVLSPLVPCSNVFDDFFHFNHLCEHYSIVVKVNFHLQNSFLLRSFSVICFNSEFDAL